MTTLPPSTAGMKMATEQDTAARAVLLAQRRNLPIPEGVHERGRVLDAVRALSAEPGVAPSTPDLTSVDAAERAIRKFAAERALATQVRGLAAEWLPLASSEWATAVTAAVPGWVPALVESFTAAWEAFRAAYAKAPEVDSSQLGSLTPEAFAAWKGAQDATRDLDLILADRVTLQHCLTERITEWDATGRGMTLAPYRPDPLMLTVAFTPPPDTPALADDRVQRAAALTGLRTTAYARAAALKGLRALSGTDLWRALLAAEETGTLTVALAGVGELPDRHTLAITWRDIARAAGSDNRDADPDWVKAVITRGQAIVAATPRRAGSVTASTVGTGQPW